MAVTLKVVWLKKNKLRTKFGTYKYYIYVFTMFIYIKGGTMHKTMADKFLSMANASKISKILKILRFVIIIIAPFTLSMLKFSYVKISA